LAASQSPPRSGRFLVDRGDIDDPTASSGILERAHHPPASQERAVKIGTHQPVELRERHVAQHHAGHIESCGIYELVDNAELGLGAREQCFHRLLVADVGLHRDAVASSVLDLREHGIGSAPISEVRMTTGVPPIAIFRAAARPIPTSPPVTIATDCGGLEKEASAMVHVTLDAGSGALTG
jgi:hypothetical protein